jgi:hypothetical protein
LTENPEGKKPHGSPRLRWEDVVKRDVKSLNGGPDWKTKAADSVLEDWLFDGMVLVAGSTQEEED